MSERGHVSSMRGVHSRDPFLVKSKRSLGLDVEVVSAFNRDEALSVACSCHANSPDWVQITDRDGNEIFSPGQTIEKYHEFCISIGMEAFVSEMPSVTVKEDCHAADNRNHSRDNLKRVRIIKPPFAKFADVSKHAGCNSFPAWVGEACVGLIFDPALLSPCGKEISVNVDDWICALTHQLPMGELSQSAAKWINKNVQWAGNIGTSVENVEILGVGRLLEDDQRCFLPALVIVEVIFD